MNNETIRTLVAVGLMPVAMTSWAGGWGNLRQSADEKPRAVNCRMEKGRFLYDGGDLYCCETDWGRVTAEEPPQVGWAYTWRFRTGFPARLRSQDIRFGTNGLFAVGIGQGLQTWTWNTLKPARRLTSGQLCVKKEIERKFWWPDDLSDLMDRYNRQPAAVDFTTTTYEITLECRGRVVYVRQQGVLTGAFTPDDSFYTVPAELRLQPDVRFRGLLKRRLPSAADAFEPVGLAYQYNSTGVGGTPITPASAPARDTRFHVNGVPFVWQRPQGEGTLDNIDVGESWFFQHRLDLAGLEWFESRRWPEAGTRFPGRLVLSAPKADYDRLYVLAASDTARPDAIDTFTVQVFGGNQTGQPKNFRSPAVPSFETAPAKGRFACGVKLADGRTVYLHLVEVPLDFTRWREFSDSAVLNFELTKDVAPWRLWPDPCYGSVNGAGLPSRVHVFALTLRKSDLPMTLTPTQLGSLFTEGESVGYDVTFSNASARATRVVGRLDATSLDKAERRSVPVDMPLAAGEAKTARLELPLERFGHYDVALTWSKGPRTVTNVCRRTLARIRNRPHDLRDMTTRGFMFGFWPWPSGRVDDPCGGHRTAPFKAQLELGGKLGMETLGAGAQLGLPFGTNEEIVAICRKYGIRNYVSHVYRYNEFGQQPGEDGIRRLEGKSLEKFNACADGSAMLPKTETKDPRIQVFFAEPGGIGTEGVPGCLYGEPNEPRTEAQSNEFYRLWFSVKCYVDALQAYEKKSGVHQVKLLPWGDPAFGVPFLDERPEPEFDAVDGTAFDAPLFGRLPEAQLTQNCSIFRAWMFNQAWRRRHPGKEPWNVSMEGPFIAPAQPSFSNDEVSRAAKAVRMMLMLGANGIPRQWSCAEISDPADYWGEEQYGGSGLFGRMTELDPHVSCSAYATVIRHLRDMEFVGWDDIPTRTVYSLRFKNWKTGEFLRVLWCLKGTREAKVRGGGELVVYDSMDNRIDATKGLTLSVLPLWVYGSDEKTLPVLGEPDNSDARLGAHAVRLGAARELLSPKRPFFARTSDDADYVDNFRIMYRKFPAAFEVKATDEGLSVAMADPSAEKDRGVMPYYTTLYCDVKLPGVPSALSLNVKAGGDWGRVVYELVDAKGEKWLSNGQKDAWNVDDQDARSYFVHEGWRWLSLGLPGNRPYDLARTLPTTWWGCTGGDGIVDYPLVLKKVYVERRPKTLYVNSLEPVPGFGPVVLGDLYAEYASGDDCGEAAVAKSRLRMTVDAVERSDPYAELKKSGTLPPTELLSVEHPVIQDRDGQKGLFSFREMEGAVRYDLYLSLDPDGRGAVKAKSLKKSGERVNGLKANRDCYAFLVWYDKKGAQSVPSPIFKYALQDIFSNK